ncbi:PiggyBac transposable element-derived protein 4 [Trichoplax sp. H2]|nr:PiggyBac transposable element-derived protein 4 [Trichoplax sp. H2]|eukprot:RDD38531.1 PiggyBac transposable element-derived protein 4 [Trichoplax sp. H2]
MIKACSATRSTFKWYKSLALFLLQISLLNAFIIYRKDQPKSRKSFLEFQHDVLSDYLFGDLEPQLAKRDTVIRLSGKHYLVKFERRSKSKKPYPLCQVCLKKKITLEVTTLCPVCPKKPGLCMDPCFLKFHSKLKYWI